MHRRTFLTGLFGVAAAGVGASIATRAEAFTLIPADPQTPKSGDAQKLADAKQPDALTERLPADARIEPVQYRRRYHRGRYYRPPVRRWRPARRRVCRTTWTRYGRRRVCTWR